MIEADPARAGTRSHGRNGMLREQSASAMAAFQRWRRLVLGIMLLTLGALLVFGRSLQPESLHEQIEAYGVVLILIGIGGRLWSTLYIGGRKSTEVVSTGPYSITRNPLYLFSAVAVAGVGAQMGSLVAPAQFALLCWAAFHLVILREESYLKVQLGAAYEAYLARVPRFLPRPWLFRDQQEVTFRPHVLNRTVLDGLAFFLSIPFFELVEKGQETGTIPVLFQIF